MYNPYPPELVEILMNFCYIFIVFVVGMLILVAIGSKR